MTNMTTNNTKADEEKAIIGNIIDTLLENNAARDNKEFATAYELALIDLRTLAQAHNITINNKDV